MRISSYCPQVEVIISLYNYQDYIKQCLDSVLQQSYKNIIINVVDDGSTDKSADIIKRHFSTYIKFTSQQNKGQLGAFNTAFRNLDVKSEIILFLDADDYMQQDYVENIIKIFGQNDCDYVFSSAKTLEHSIIKPPAKIQGLQYGDINFAIFSSYYLLTYYGESTSSIAITKDTLAKILPLNLESKWRIRADDCIIYGAALVGAKIHYANLNGIIYRIHSANNYCGKNFGIKYHFNRILSVQELFHTILEKNSIALTYNVFIQEYLLAQKPRKLRYIKILCLCHFTFLQKLYAFLKILIH